MDKQIFNYYNDKIKQKYEEIAEIEREIQKLKNDYKREIGGQFITKGAIVVND